LRSILQLSPAALRWLPVKKKLKVSYRRNPDWISRHTGQFVGLDGSAGRGAPREVYQKC